jgi:signal transduction histidine kinase
MARTVPRWLLPGELAALGRRTPRPGRTARDWAVDLVLFGAAAAVWVETWTAAPPYYVEAVPGWMSTADPWVGAVACLALWWRRRWPVTIALGTLGALMVADSALGPSLVMVLTVAVHRDWPVASLVTVGYLVPTTFFIATNPQPGLARWPGVVLVALMYLVPLGWGLAVRARRQLVVSLRRDAERERQEHRLRLADARRAERERIAREMHDVLAHRVSLISVHAGALSYRTTQADAGSGRPLDPAEVGQAIDVISDNARHALVELREVLSVLRDGDAPLDGDAGRLDGDEPPQPRIADIARLVGEARAAGQRVAYHPGVDGADGLPPAVQRTVYRAVQEGLTNARKHAPGAAVEVTVAGSPGAEVVATVTNPLTVPAPAALPGAGAGLAGLEERAALDGGTVEHGVCGDGFRLRARIPWPA